VNQPVSVACSGATWCHRRFNEATPPGCIGPVADPVVFRAHAASGIVAVLYLDAVELLVIRAICLWCTGVHVVTVALFAVVLFGQATVVED